MATPIERWDQHLIEKRHVSFPLEIILLVQIDNCAVSKRTAPKIFCVFRSPRVGTCGWLATRAQVACKVGVCRNDASSSKTITAPSRRAFF